MAAVVIMSMLVSSSHCAPMSGESMPKESTEEALVAGEMMRQLFTNAEAARQQQQQAVDENLRELGLALLRKASSGTRSQSKRAGKLIPKYLLAPVLSQTSHPNSCHGC